jgi:Domain of unknown function (DUF932)
METRTFLEKSPVNALHASPDTGPRYSFVSTRSIIALAEQQGFRLASVAYPRRGKTGEYGAHTVRLDMPDSGGMESKEYRPQIVVHNGHDGRTALRLMGGVFRLICENGLVAGNAFLNQRIFHVGIKPGSVETALDVAARQVKQLHNSVDRFRSRDLSHTEIREFTRSAIAFRAAIGGLSAADTAAAITEENEARTLQARRADDLGSNLWHVYNRVQENLIRGNSLSFHGEDGKNHGMRGVRAIDASLKLNQSLWELADRFAA